MTGGKRLFVCWKTQGDIGKSSRDVYGFFFFLNYNFSDVTQSQSNVQNFVISHSFFPNQVSN